MRKTIGILGGMGPMATCDLMQKVIENTDAACDQAHLPILVDCNTNIPDRTAAILHGGADPRPEMVKSAQRLQAAGAELIIMPCNTAHYFIDAVQESVDIPVLNIQQETAACLKAQGVTAAAILATDGTVQSGLYHSALQKAGITPICPDEQEQAMLMSVIYDYVKAGKVYPYPEKIRAMEDRLAGLGVQRLILGCTELPIAFAEWNTRIETIDPTAVLARAAVLKAGGKVTSRF